jgi:DNA-directed RNA polymerase specialized sigma24 family protein
MDVDEDRRFEEFVADVEPRLRRALSGHVDRGDVADCVAAALGYAWENRQRVYAMENPAGYLYRVAQSSSRKRMQGFLPWPGDRDAPMVEPGLPAALAELPDGEARAVWLVSACWWSHREAAEALGLTTSTISTQVSRGMIRLRTEMGVTSDA